MMEELKCSFCEDLFTGPKNIFCKDCMKESLELLIEKDKKAHNGAECCPLCSAKMTKTVVESIPNNFLDKVRCLIRILSKREEDSESDATSDTTSSSSEDDDTTAGVILTGCGKCEGDVPAVSWCMECQDSLCPSCDEVHGKWKDYREHETITIEEFEHRRGRTSHCRTAFCDNRQDQQSASKQLSAAYGQSEYCKSHITQKLNLYCKTCNSLICEDCILNDHQDHDVVTANKVKSNAVAKGSSQKEKHKKGSSDNKELLWVAKLDYSSSERNHLNLKKGDLLYVINTDMGDCWYARTKHTDQKGYIPCCYIEQLEALEAKELKCSCCEDIFAKQKTIFCKSCIQDSIESSFEPDYNEQLDTLNCPFCRQLISQLHSDELTAHFKQKVTQVITILSKQNEGVINKVSYSDSDAVGMVMIGCGNCEKSCPAISWCTVCRSTLCSQCDQVHGKWREFKAHKMMPIDEFQKRKRKRKEQPEYCKSHTNQPLDLYCKTCGSLICRDCTLKDHRHHKFITANKTTDKKESKRNTKAVSKLLSKEPLFVGKYDYYSGIDDELNFEKGDLLYIINTDEGNWWYARSKRTGKEGYIPNNYVTEFDGALDTESWYFGAITRKDAEKQLMQPFNAYGSFLIRESDTTPGNYTLAIRDKKKVKHYKIHKLDGGGFYVNPQVTFEDIPKLVDYYSKQAGILCVNLKVACLLDKSSPGRLNNDDAYQEVDKSSICLVKRLSGTSSFNEVWQGMWNDITPVAVKMLKPDTIGATKFLKESTLMKKLKHQNVIQLYGVCTREEPIYIITELMKHGSLLEYLRGDGRSLKLPQLIDMGAQVASGMAYLEEKNYIHQYLAARSILVSENLICKVAKFDQVKALREGICVVHTGVKLPIKWTAPEAVMYSRFTIKSDVWSFGILMYELITYGRFPYPEMNNRQVFEALQTGYRMPCPMGCPEQLYKIMRECWRDDAASRPTFETLQWQLEEFFTDDAN